MSTTTLLRSRSYRLASPVRLVTEDAIPLVGARVGRGPALVLCHGFLGWHRKTTIVRFVERMARWFTVYALDLRGHGGSGGVSTFGDREFLDVDAAVTAAREETGGAVATMGISMGGIAVLRQAAYRGGAGAVVAVSTPARWDGHRSRAVRQMRWLISRPEGRRMARALGVRLTETWDRPEDPEAVIGRIGPAPVIVVHGRDDRFFDEEEAWRLYRAARPPKRLMLAGRFGHAEDGLGPTFAERLAPRIMSALQA